MLKYCSRCGTFHEFNYKCQTKRVKKETQQNSYRNTYDWRKTRERIKERDFYLCQVCLTGKHETVKRYTTEQLQVHHIIPLEEDFELRNEDDNLITLCPFHHRLAEDGEITREELFSLIRK